MSRSETNLSPRALESQALPSRTSERGRSRTIASFFGTKTQNQRTSSKSVVQKFPPTSTVPRRRQSFERKVEAPRVSRPPSVKAQLERRKSNASSLNGVELQKAPRDVQREMILKYLSRDGPASVKDTGEDPTVKLSDEEQAAALVDIADERQATGELIFNRFQRLCILDILQCQHRIVVIDEQIQFGREEESVANIDMVHRAIQRYTEAIEAFQKLSNLKQPGFQASNLSGRALALALHEPRYWDSPDALNVFDLAPADQDHSIDRIRLWLQRVVPNGFLDIWGKERREIDLAASKLPAAKPRHNLDAYDGHILDDIGSKEAKKIIASYHQRPHHISPVVDTATRVLVAIVGGLLVLVPMTVLSYITEFRWVLFITFAFTIVFSVGLSIMSRASNDQIIMATAAYGAVLVVFVGNFLTKSTP